MGTITVTADGGNTGVTTATGVTAGTANFTAGTDNVAGVTTNATVTGDYNVSTTVISNATLDTGDRLASTALA